MDEQWSVPKRCLGEDIFFMLCNTYLGMVLMKAYEKKNEGKRKIINREYGYKTKI